MRLSIVTTLVVLFVPVSVLAGSSAGGSLNFPVTTDGYTGPGVEDGINQAAPITGASADIRTLTINILQEVLLYMGLAAVTAIIIAGIILVIGGISEERRELARKIIFWAVGGLIVILLAAALVTIVVNAN